MSADNILQFIPRANPKADRAFWKGPTSPVLQTLEHSIVNHGYPADTAPSEYNHQADEKDPA